MRKAKVFMGLSVGVSYTLLVGILLLVVLSLTTAIADGWKVHAAEAAVAERSPSFSPDGSHIAFLRTQGGAPRLWVMGSDGVDQRPLAAAARFSWTVDGRALLFTRAGGNRVFRVGIEGGPTSAVRARLGAVSTRWRGSVVFVRNHHVALRDGSGNVWSLT